MTAESAETLIAVMEGSRPSDTPAQPGTHARMLSCCCATDYRHLLGMSGPEEFVSIGIPTGAAVLRRVCDVNSAFLAA